MTHEVRLRPQDLRIPGVPSAPNQTEALKDDNRARRFWKQHSQWAADPALSFPSHLVPRTQLPPAERPGGHKKAIILWSSVLGQKLPENMQQALCPQSSPPQVCWEPHDLGLTGSEHSGIFHHSSCWPGPRAGRQPSALPADQWMYPQALPWCSPTKHRPCSGLPRAW